MKSIKILANVLILLSFISSAPVTLTQQSLISEFKGKLNFDLAENSEIKNTESEKLLLLENISIYQKSLDKIVADGKTQLENKDLFHKEKLSLMQEVEKLSGELGLYSASIEANDLKLTQLEEAKIIIQQNIIKVKNEIESQDFSLKEIRDVFDLDLQFLELAKLDLESFIESCELKESTYDCQQDSQYHNLLKVIQIKESNFDSSKMKLNSLVTQIETNNKLLQDTVKSFDQNISEYNDLDFKNTKLKVELNEVKLTYPQKNERIEYLNSKILETIRLLAKLNFDKQKYTDLLKQENESLASISGKLDILKRQAIKDILKLNTLGVETAKKHASLEADEIITDISNKYARPKGVKDGIEIGLKLGALNAKNSAAELAKKSAESDAQFYAKLNSFSLVKEENVLIKTKKMAKYQAILDANYLYASFQEQDLIKDEAKENYLSNIEIEVLEQAKLKVVELNKNRILNTKVISPSYQETFSNDIPSFPGVTGKYFDNKSSESDELLNRAYTAGYNEFFEPTIEEIYYSKIAKVFNDAYEEELEKSKLNALNTNFNDIYEKEFNNAYQIYYKEKYQQELSQESDKILIVDNITNQVIDQTIFDKEYEVNLEIQKDLNKSELTSIYASELNYNSDSPEYIALLEKQLSDLLKSHLVKVNFIKVNEMPNALGLDISLSNYSQSDVSSLVLLTNNEKYSLPSLPAGMNVLLKNVVSLKIKSNIDSLNIKVVDSDVNSSVYAEKDGLLYEENIKVDLHFPLVLSEIDYKPIYFLNEQANFKLKLKNSTQDSFKGPITVSITDKLNFNKIYESSITEINQELELSFSVESKDLSNLFQQNNFDILIKKGDLVLFAYRTPVINIKKKFDLANTKAVIITNSSTSLNRELILDNLKYILDEEFNILDLAITENLTLAPILNRDHYLIIDSKDSLVTTTINDLSNKKTLFLTLGNSSRDIYTKLKSLKDFKSLIQSPLKTYSSTLSVFIDDPLKSENESVIINLNSIEDYFDIIEDKNYLLNLLKVDSLFKDLPKEKLNSKNGINFSSVYELYRRLSLYQLNYLSQLDNKILKLDETYKEFIPSQILKSLPNEVSLYFKNKMIRTLKNHSESKKYKSYPRQLKKKIKQLID